MSTHQQDLDHIATKLATLDLDSILCVTINSLAMHRGTSRHMLLNRLKTVMITLAHTFDDTDKALAIDLLRDAADRYENVFMMQLNDKKLN